jgi:uncharacterized protein YecE (DUF72 family)
MAGPIVVGTASWTDKTLIDAGWYPADCTSAECRLRYYASQFPMVEVDASYYAMPSRRNADLWVQRTPEHFVFDIKSFRLFTGHQTPPKALPKDIRSALPSSLAEKRNVYYKDFPEELKDEMWGRYAAAIGPLSAAGKLGVVLFQYPPWVRPAPRVFDHIEECRDRLAGFDLAVEFRNRAWFSADQRQESLDFLRRLNLSLVVVDEPQGFDSSVPTVSEVTGPYAIVRFHGRNTATWEAKGLSAASDRFNYEYSRSELEPWAETVRSLAERAVIGTHVVFNTNYGRQGPDNAMVLADLLGTGLGAE